MEFNTHIRKILSDIQRLLEAEEYRAAARECSVGIEQAFKHVFTHELDKLQPDDRQTVQAALQRRRKGIERFTLGDCVHVLRESKFLDAWGRVSGKDPSRVRWFALDGFRGFRNEITHEFRNVTKAEAEALFTHLYAILEDFELIDINDTDNTFSSDQKMRSRTVNNASEKNHSTLSFTHGHALIIGIGADLPITVSDAKGVANILRDPSCCAYPDHQVVLLTEEQATRTAIFAELKNLSQITNEESTVLIYFSGHGGRIDKGPHTGEYLVAADTDTASPKTLAKTAISGAVFTEALRAIKVRKIVVILDCCHAGGIAHLKIANFPQLKIGLTEEYYAALAQGRGRAVLTSSRDDEYSHILAGDNNSLFTKYLLIGLRGEAASDDGFIRIFDLFHYLQPKVIGDNANQHPIFRGDMEENFPIALHDKGGRETSSKDDKDFCYDAYVSYVDQEPDKTWVRNILIPRLKGADLERGIISQDVLQPGVDKIVGISQGLKQAKRTLVVLSKAYVKNNWIHFENIIGQTIGIQEGTYRVLPVKIEPLNEEQLPIWLSRMVIIDLSDPYDFEARFDTLIRALKEPLSRIQEG